MTLYFIKYHGVQGISEMAKSLFFFSLLPFLTFKKVATKLENLEIFTLSYCILECFDI